MKKLIVGILVLALAWCGYWFVGSRMLKTHLNDWFAARQAEGWQADYSGFAIQGFPNRFDATWVDLALADPDSGLALRLPRFQINMLSYQPHQMIAVFPKDMTIATPGGGKLLFTDSDLRASLSVHSGGKMELKEGRLTAKEIRVGGSVSGGAKSLSLAMRQDADTPTTYRLGLDAEGVIPPSVLVGSFTRDVALPNLIDSLKLDATVDFTQAWDKTSLAASRPQPRDIKLTDASASWGELSLRANGDLKVDAQGHPDGKLHLQAKHWKEMLQAAVNAGALDDGVARTAEATLGLMAGLGGNSQTLDVTLSFHDGKTWLGPVPVAAAPVIRLR